MAVTGISTLAVLISNQSLGQEQNAPAEGQPVEPKNVAAANPIGDIFTPSAQANAANATAQDAGIFQVTQSALSSATADVLSAQAASAQAAQNAAPQQAAPGKATGTATGQVPPAGTPNLPNPAITKAALPPTKPAPSAAPQPIANTVTQVQANAQNEQQSLNAALLALGLSDSDIQDVDRIASFTKDYNPASYTDLIQQLNAQEPHQTSAPADATQPAAETEAPTA